MGKNKKTTPQKRKCVLCGRPLFNLETDAIVGATGRIVCYQCLDISRRLQPARNTGFNPRAFTPPETDIQTPQDIINALNGAIIGQSNAKEAIALAMWKQMNRANGDKNIPKPNLMLVGPTGCGKTALLQAAAKFADLPFMIFDSSTITQNGYRGRDAEDVISDLFKCHGTHRKVQYGIIFMDEFDKLAASTVDPYLGAFSKGAQHALLKIVEGASVMVDGKPFDTSNLMFVFGGAFTAMQKTKAAPKFVGPIGFNRAEYGGEKRVSDAEPFSVSDFVANGMEPELMGRVGQIVQMNELTEQELIQILFESELSVFRRYQRFFGDRGIQLNLPNETARGIAQDALERGTGARGLNANVEERIAPLLMQYANKTLPNVVYIR